MLNPAPAALISCQAPGGRPNLVTVAWCGTVNSDPPMLSISLRPSRHSFAIIRDSGEFVVNLPSVFQAEAVDRCGVVSGRAADKFALSGLTPAPAANVACPIVAECPVNIECTVFNVMELGSHSLFLARVAGVQVSEDLLNRAGRLELERARLLCFAHGFYHELGAKMGHFGWSVRKRPAKTESAGAQARFSLMSGRNIVTRPRRGRNAQT